MSHLPSSRDRSNGPIEDTIAGGDARVSGSTHEASGTTPPPNSISLNLETQNMSDLSLRDSSEDDAHVGAQESSNPSVESSPRADSRRRRNHHNTRGRAYLTDHENIQKDPSKNSVESHRHSIVSTPNFNVATRSRSPAFRQPHRVSFDDNALPAADTISLPESNNLSGPNSPVHSAIQNGSSTSCPGSLEQLQRLSVSSSKSRKDHEMQNIHESNKFVTSLPDSTSIADWAGLSTSGGSVSSIPASQVPLPASVASSTLSEDLYAGPTHVPSVPLGGSFEQFPVPVESTPHPTRKKKVALLNWIAGPPRPKKKPQRSVSPESQSSDRPPTAAPETEDYRASIEELASHFPTFRNVSVVETRHEWSSRIVLYDRDHGVQDSNGVWEDGTSRYEPWPLEETPDPPPFQEFHDTLKDVSDDCEQRLILVEDLTPALVDLLGATFQIPPHVFEEHLERSGYTGVVDDRDDAATWHTRPSAHGYSSITWYRPVLPLVPVTPKFYAKIISDAALPQVQCPIEGCKKHSLWLDTTANIWRHQLDLCTNPGSYYKSSLTKYPVGWEERATVWTQKVKDCKFGMSSNSSPDLH